MTVRAADRGQPLVMLGMLLGGWIVLRTAFWQSPVGDASPLAALPPQGAPAFAAPQDGYALPVAAIPVSRRAWPALPISAAAIVGEGAFAESGPATDFALIVPTAFGPSAGHIPLALGTGPGLRLGRTPSVAPFPPETAAAKPLAGGRWSADAWLLLRSDSATAATAGRGSYGGSQLGAVLRYHLRPSSPHRPAAYFRVSQAFAAARESDLAAGLAARPMPRVPVAMAGEVRLTRSGGATLLRPAAYAVTELPPVGLPGGITAEAYLQAGYVGGRHATGFVGGQVRVDRKLFDLGSAELRGGGGMWGGAQKGVSRLDAGPGASLRLKIGEVPARVSLDWRFRVAGTAEPNSGPALTISAGF